MGDDKRVVVERTGGISIGFTGLLTLVFVAGRVFGFIDWAWIWVFSPLWIPFALLIAILLLALAGIGISALIGAIFRKRRRRKRDLRIIKW